MRKRSLLAAAAFALTAATITAAPSEAASKTIGSVGRITWGSSAYGMGTTYVAGNSDLYPSQGYKFTGTLKGSLKESVANTGNYSEVLPCTKTTTNGGITSCYTGNYLGRRSHCYRYDVTVNGTFINSSTGAKTAWNKTYVDPDPICF